jgi:hypothetical protein
MLLFGGGSKGEGVPQESDPNSSDFTIVVFKVHLLGYK